MSFEELVVTIVTILVTSTIAVFGYPDGELDHYDA